jgi:hypothetical protein
MKLPLFVPILTAFTARVAGREMAQLLGSPTALARALADTQTVIGHDGVLCHFDPLLLASACLRSQAENVRSDGTEGVALRSSAEVPQAAPLATLLESIQPLRRYLPEGALIYATFAGPGLLYSQLQAALESCGETGGVDPDYVVDVIRDVVRSALELKADGIALIEQTVPAAPAELLRCHKTVRKLADFYDAGFLLFRLPASEQVQHEFQAHCLFDLEFTENGMGPVTGKLGPATVSSVLPFTTAGDVAETTTVEELKTLLQGLRGA